MFRFAVAGLLMGLAAGCAGADRQAAPDSSAILPSEIRQNLSAGEQDFSPDQVYLTARAEGQRYDKALLDPVMYFAPLEQMRVVSPGDRQTLLNNFYLFLKRELSKDYTLVRSPEAGAARVQFAVLPVTQEDVAMDTVSLVAPDAGDNDVVRSPLASPIIVRNTLVVEAEWTDSMTGAVLGATVDRHFGRQSIDPGTVTSWSDVNRFLEDYAVLIRYRLCRFRGATNCIVPPDSLR